MDGWVSVHRKITENWLWKDKPFAKGQAWVDLIMLASYSENKFALGNELITVEKGSFVTSELKLMDRWGWSKTKVRSFLDLLQKDEMIVKKTDHKKTTITVVNYSDYQELETIKKPQKNREETASRPQKNTINKKNKDNKDNNSNNVELIKDIVNYLNEKAGTSYRYDSAVTQKHINARMAEKYTLDDFKTVIDKKTAEWKNTDMAKYIRPETLFGSKFENYLNQNAVPAKKATKFINFQQRDMDVDALEKELLSNGGY